MLRAGLVFAVLLLAAVAVGGEEESSGGGIVSVDEDNSTVDRIVVHVNGKAWSRPWPVIVAAILLLAGAIAAPLLVPWIISFFIQSKIDEEVAGVERVPSIYGTFSPEATDASIGAGLDIAPTDLPPKLEVRWNKSAWKMVHRQLDLPLGLAVSAALLSFAIQVLKLPAQWDYIYVRRIANDIAQLFMIATACFALHRFVELVIEFLEHQAWIARTHMESLYKEIAGKIGWVVKFVGAMLIILSVVGLTAEESWTRRLFFAFVTALALGLLGWILLELSEVAQELVSSGLIMAINMFTIGDEVEVFLLDHGVVKGRVISTRIGTTELLHEGRTSHVPNSFFLKGCVVNHTRSHNSIILPTFVNAANTPPEKIRQFIDGARQIAGEISKHSHASLQGAVGAGPIPFVLQCRFRKRESASQKRTEMMLRLLQLAREIKITFHM